MNRMIIKKMTVMECWCPNCGTGQMEQILDTSFKENKGLEDFIDKEIVCKNCQKSNIVDDVVNLIPTAFEIHSNKDLNKYKRDESMNNHLNNETSPS